MNKFTNRYGWGKHYIHNLLSYFLVLFIPLIILATFYSSRIKKTLFDEIYETVDLELAQISIQMDNELNSMRSIVGQLTLSGTLSTALWAQSPLELAPVISDLSGFRSASPFIEDIALILERQNYVTTATSTCDKSFYFSLFLSSPDYDMSLLEKQLISCSYSRAFPQITISNAGLTSSMKKMILFSYPIYSGYETQEGTMLFFVSSASVKKLLNQKLQSYQAQIYILDPYGTVITSYGENPSTASRFSDFPQDLSQLPDRITEDGANYLIRSYTSPDSFWSYVAFIPDTQNTFSQVASLTREFVIAIVITLFLSGCIIWFLQKYNYAPVQKLQEQAKRVIPIGKTPDSRPAVIPNELSTISNALDYLSSQNTALTAKLSGNQAAVKNHRLLRLLGGDYISREDFNLDCSELNMELPYPFLTVGILLISPHASDYESWMSEFRKNVCPYVLYYCPHSFNPGQIVLLINAPTAGSAWTIQHILEPLKDFLAKRYSLTVTIGTGSCVDCTAALPQSCMEAASALDYRFVKGNGTIIEFHEALGAENPRIMYPNKEFEALRNALLSNDEENIRHTIEDILHFMEQNHLPLYLARSVCFDLIHLVNVHCQKEGSSISASPLALSGVETSQEILRMLYTWSRNLTNLGKPNPKKMSFQEVIQYIQNGCMDGGFSAYETAEHFGMTLPAFSKYFKEMSGQNVMDYIISQRMEKAKELLTNTTLPLKDIAGQVGYYNVSSFTRRFKLHQGVTPGDYRKSQNGISSQSAKKYDL